MSTTSVTQEQSTDPVIDRLFSIDETATLLALSPWTVRAWVAKGRIGSNKVGARRLIPLSEIHRIIKETAVPAHA